MIKTEDFKRVLFKIHWDSAWNHYFMNAGAFDHEEEILSIAGQIHKLRNFFLAIGTNSASLGEIYLVPI